MWVRFPPGPPLLPYSRRRERSRRLVVVGLVSLTLHALLLLVLLLRREPAVRLENTPLPDVAMVFSSPSSKPAATPEPGSGVAGGARSQQTPRGAPTPAPRSVAPAPAPKVVPPPPTPPPPPAPPRPVAPAAPSAPASPPSFETRVPDLTPLVEPPSPPQEEPSIASAPPPPPAPAEPAAKPPTPPAKAAPQRFALVVPPVRPRRPTPAPRSENGFPTPIFRDWSLGATGSGNGRPNARRGPRSEVSSDLKGATALGADWMNEFMQWVDEHKRYPEQAAINGDEGDVAVDLVVDRDGRVRSVALDQRSGSPFLDMGLVAMFRGRRLPPFPYDTSEQELTLNFTMHYIIVR